MVDLYSLLSVSTVYCLTSVVSPLPQAQQGLNQKILIAYEVEDFNFQAREQTDKLFADDIVYVYP